MKNSDLRLIFEEFGIYLSNPSKQQEALETSISELELAIVIAEHISMANCKIPDMDLPN